LSDVGNINYPSSDFLEMIAYLPNIESFINEEIRILLWFPGSNIEKSLFTGLNFESHKNLFSISNFNQLTNYKNQDFDYFFIHGYELREFDTDILVYNNIKIKNFCIDLLGEGFDIDMLLDRNVIQSKIDKLNSNVKILIPFSHYNDLEELYPSYKFFKYEFGGPRLFCSRYNRDMIHGHYLKEHNKVRYELFYPTYKYGYDQVVYGLEWSETPKHKLYMCLNGEPRNHRIFMYKTLLDRNLIDEGYVTFKSNIKKIISFPTNEDEIIQKYVVLPQRLLDESNFEARFGLHTPLSKQSYVEVVTESHHTSLPFKTEKCVKPFYNLQFPIILGHQNIINDLRKMDFDVFDDVIDHSYDGVEIKSISDIIYDDISIKTNMIADELEKLNRIDIHSVYLKNKERFLYNQENLYKKTILENNIFQDLGKFIFGDDIKVMEYNFDKIEKLIIS
jgi:hypothetical protein